MIPRPKRPEELEESTLEGIVEQQFPQRKKVRRRRPEAASPETVESALQPRAEAPKPPTLETAEQIEDVGSASEMTVTAEEVEALWSQELLDLIQNTAAAFAEAATQPPVDPGLVQTHELVGSETRAFEAGDSDATAPAHETPTGTIEVPTMTSESNESSADTAGTETVGAETAEGGATADAAASAADSPSVAEAENSTAAETAGTENATEPAATAVEPSQPEPEPAEPAPEDDSSNAEAADAIDFDELAREAEGVLSEVSMFADGDDEGQSESETTSADAPAGETPAAESATEPASPMEEPEGIDPFATVDSSAASGPSSDDAQPPPAFDTAPHPSQDSIPDPLDALADGQASAPVVPTVVALNAEDSLALRQIRTDVQALEGQQKHLVSSIETVRQDVRETKIDTAANTKATVEALASLRTMQGRLVAESRARAKATASPARTPVVLGIAVLAISWGIAYYFKTGDLKLALAGVVAANLLGCLALFARR